MATTLEGGAGDLAVHHLTGDPENSNVLLVCHATGFHGRCYRALGHELADTVRTVALDFRGHGDSTSPPLDAFGWAGMSDDVQRTLDWLRSTGAETIHGFGHSMGGAALIDAERHSPDSFASILLFEPILPPSGILNPADSPIVKGALARTRRFPSHAAALARYAARPPLGLFRADVLHDYVVHGFAEQPDGSVELKCTPEQEAQTFLNAAQDITLEHLSDIDSTFFIAKSGDGGLPAKLVDAVVEHAAGARPIEFNDITHFGPLQDPVGVANTLRTIIVV